MSENFYTILLNKTWIGIGLADKMQGIKTIGRLAYKKDIFYTEQRLSQRQRVSKSFFHQIKTINFQ